MGKPHFKTGATNVEGDVVPNIAKNTLMKQQGGNRLMVSTTRLEKRPPSRQGRHQPVSKKTKRKTSTKNKSASSLQSSDQTIQGFV